MPKMAISVVESSKRDSLSCLLFNLTLIPLSRLQKETDYGCKAYEKGIISHFYMDDLKMQKSDQKLLGILHTVKQFSNDIRMESVLDKCVKSTFVKGN